AATELASRSARRRAPPASVPGASTANSVALRRPITSDNRAADLIACTYRPRPAPPCGGAAPGSGGPRCRASAPHARGPCSRIGPKRATQLDARHVRQLGVHQDHVRLRGAGALEGMLTGALLENGVPATLQQAPEPASRLLSVAGQEHEWQSALWHPLGHSP